MKSLKLTQQKEQRRSNYIWIEQSIFNYNMNHCSCYHNRKAGNHYISVAIS